MSNTQNISTWKAVGLVWQLLVLIALPTTLLALAGRWVDTRYGTTPWATLAGLVIALTLALLVALREGRRIAKDL